MVPQYREGAVRALATLNRRCLCPCQPQPQPLRTGRPQARRPLSSTCRPRDATASLQAIERYNGSTRQYSTARAPPPKNIAVLGGGLTGLATARHLMLFMPTAKITVYEGSGRLGGWIDTETVEVEGLHGEKGVVKFERGARMVKPYGITKWDDVAFYEMISDLKLASQLWGKPEDPDRFIYYPDHLVSLPSGADFNTVRKGAPMVLYNLLSTFLKTLNEPLFERLYPSLLGYYQYQADPNNRELIWKEDLSVGDYMLRVFGGNRELIDNALSAMMHGVYGGDVWNLSMASNSMVGPVFKHASLPATRPGALNILSQDRELLREFSRQPVQKLMTELGNKSLGFRNGFGTLVDALVESLEANPNVSFAYQPVNKLELLPDNKIQVTSSTRVNDESVTHNDSYDKVISTLYSRTLSAMAPPNALPSLAATSAVTIRLVNLWSPHPNLNAPNHGFGYLLPQTVPAENNPHAALGVIFDSDARPDPATATDPTTDNAGGIGNDNDNDAIPPYGDTVPGTKLTVMLGGHQWSGLPEEFLPEAYTSDQAAVEAAKETVAIQLGIPPEAWTATSTKLCVDCIPQQTVGHAGRMRRAERELRAAFKGRLAVCGGSYTAPGVAGSLRAARDVAAQTAGRMRLRDGLERADSVGETGLGRFAADERRLWKEEDTEYLKGFRRRST